MNGFLSRSAAATVCVGVSTLTLACAYSASCPVAVSAQLAGPSAPGSESLGAASTASADAPSPASSAKSGAKRKAAATSTRSAAPIGKANRLKHALRELACDDAARVQEALRLLREDGSRAVGRPVAARIRDGLPPPLLLQAIGVLVETGQRQVAGKLVELLRHRRSEIRRAALEALGSLRYRRAQTQLLAALRDPAEEVRVTAAATLAFVGVPRAVPALLAAHDNGVEGAIDAVGQLVGHAHVELLLERARGSGLDAVLPALEASLQRPRLPAHVKVRIIRAVSESSSASASHHLARWLESGVHGVQARLARELIAGIARAEKRAVDGALPAEKKETAAQAKLTQRPSQ